MWRTKTYSVQWLLTTYHHNRTHTKKFVMSIWGKLHQITKNKRKWKLDQTVVQCDNDSDQSRGTKANSATSMWQRFCDVHRVHLEPLCRSLIRISKGNIIPMHASCSGSMLRVIRKISRSITKSNERKEREFI